MPIVAILQGRSAPPAFVVIAITILMFSFDAAEGVKGAKPLAYITIRAERPEGLYSYSTL
jgi:hypothetical protein